MKIKLMLSLFILTDFFLNSSSLSSNPLDLLANVAVSRLNSENEKPSNQQKSNLSSEVMKIATSSVDMSNMSSENSFNSSNIQNNLPKQEKSFVKRRREQFLKENPNPVKCTDPNRNLYNKRVYWTNYEARERKLAKMRKKYTEKKLLEKALLDTQSLNN
ncbi:MAG: hypothetical protein ACXWL2_03885 [Candidatus Chromulinivorax sp.]